MKKHMNYTSIFDAPNNEPHAKPRKHKKAAALIAAVLCVCILGAVAFAAVKFLPKKAELTDEGSAVLSLEAESITEITTSFGDNKITLIKENDKWFNGEQEVTDNSAVKTLIERCSNIMSIKSMENPDDEYGFMEPYGIVKITAGKNRYTVTIGGAINDGYARYFKVTGDDNVYLMLQTITEEYNISAEDLKSETSEEASEDLGSASNETGGEGNTTA